MNLSPTPVNDNDLTINSVSDTNFQAEVLEFNLPVLVDFWAPWCGPCHRLSPILEKIHAHYAGKLRVVKLNIDDHAQIATQYNIHSIPALLLFKNGVPLDQTVGVRQASDLIRWLDQHL